jgi:hypothetical protein
MTIHQVWDDKDIWDPDTSYLDYGVPVPVSFRPQITEANNLAHITGHSMAFTVASAHVWRLNQAGTNYVSYLYTTDPLETSSDPNTVVVSTPDLSRYQLAAFNPSVAGDSGGGVYTTGVNVALSATEVVDELELESIDETVWKR